MTDSELQPRRFPFQTRSEAAPSKSAERDDASPSSGSVAEMEAMDDVADLRDQSIPSPGTTTWTVQDFRRVIAPLLRREPKDWPPDSLRVELLSSREYPPEGTLSSDEKAILTLSLPLYEEKFRDSPGCWLHDALSVTVGELHDVIKPLISAGVETWSPQLIRPAVDMLRGRNSVDARNASAAALEAWCAFQELWVPYVTERPELQRALDPYYVIIDIGNGVPGGLVGHINNYPPAGCAVQAPVPVNGSNFLFSTPSRQAAAHFVGTLQGKMPGLRAWITQGNIAVPTYT